jgi:DNA-binding transcriptional MerR regulator
MLRSILLRPSYHDYLCSFNEADGGDGGGGGGNGGDGGGNGNEGQGTTPPAGENLSKAEVDTIVKGRVEQTRKATADSIAKDLGVSLEDAKRIIKESQDQSDAQKTEAQRAREAADREKADAETEKQAAAQERHDARVEKLLVRALPRDLDDDVLDKRVTKLGRLLDVEVGADEATIKTAIDGLCKEWPELFPTDENEGSNGNGNGTGKVPSGDPKGKPAPKKPAEDAYTRGAERAKAQSPGAGYAVLEGLK